MHGLWSTKDYRGSPTPSSSPTPGAHSSRFEEMQRAVEFHFSITIPECEGSKLHRFSLTSEGCKRKLVNSTSRRDHVFRGHGVAVFAYDLSNDKTKVVTVGEEICVWDFEHQEIQEIIYLEDENSKDNVRRRVTSLSFSRDDQHLLVWSETTGTDKYPRHDHRFHIYDLHEGSEKPNGRLQGWHLQVCSLKYPVTTMAASPDNSTAVYVSQASNIEAQNIIRPENRLGRRFRGSYSLQGRLEQGTEAMFSASYPIGGPWTASYSRDGKFVVLAHESGVRLYDTKRRTPSWARIGPRGYGQIIKQLSFCSRNRCFD